jgi:hypothetical protein
MNKLTPRFTLAALLFAAASAQAQTAPSSAPFLRASIASTDAANKLAAELGLPVPDLKMLLEKNFPFLGKDAMAGDKPLGVLFFGSDALPIGDQNIVFVLPANAGKLTPESLLQQGGRSIPEQPGLVNLSGMSFRRSATDLLFKQGASDFLAAVADSPFAADYRQPRTLGLLSFNLATFKKTQSASYREFMDGIKGNPDRATSSPDEKMGQAMAEDFIDHLEKVTIAIGQDDTSLHLKTWLSPFAVKAVKPMPQPGFPADAILQVHVVYPGGAEWLGNYFEKMPNEAFNGLTPEDVGKAKPLMKRASNLFFDGDAVSVAVAVRKGKPVVFLVAQRSKPANYAAELKTITDEAKSIGKKEAQPASEISTYSSGNTTVTRLAIGNPSSDDRVYIDAIEQGNILMFTFSPDTGHYVSELPVLGMKGTTSVICAGVLDLQGALSAGAEGGGPFAMMPPNTLQSLRAAFAGQAISWTLQTGTAGEGQANYLYGDLQVPTVVVKQLAQLAVTELGISPSPTGQ